MARLKLLAVLSLIALFALSAAADQGLGGGALYLHGKGQDQIGVSLGDPPMIVKAEDYACARCHGARGQGGREGGVDAPALITDGLDVAAQRAWLDVALREGVGRDGRTLLSAMPRYALSARDLDALSSWVGRLPYVAQPGLDAAHVRIVLNTDGSTFTQAEQAWLKDVVQEEVARINAEGALYGRMLELVDDDDNAWFGIGWTANPSRTVPQVAVRAAQNVDPVTCRSCCATVHPDLATQWAKLKMLLQSQGEEPVLVGSLADELESAASRVSAVERPVRVYAGVLSRWPPSNGAPLYIFSDLGLPAAVRDDVLVVVPVDLRKQIAGVEAFQRSEALPDADPRLVSAALELKKALSLLAGAISDGGRQAEAMQVCASLRSEAHERYRMSLMRLSDGSVVGQSW